MKNNTTDTKKPSRQEKVQALSEDLEKSIREFMNGEKYMAFLSIKYLLWADIERPQTFREISIATKKCFSQALKDELPIYFQTGVIVPYKHILEERYTEASVAFIPIEKTKKAKNIRLLPKGKAASIYHCGDYLSVDRSYKKLLEYCKDQQLTIVSDSYEFCINDYITSGDENEYITEIFFYVQ